MIRDIIINKGDKYTVSSTKYERWCVFNDALRAYTRSFPYTFKNLVDSSLAVEVDRHYPYTFEVDRHYFFYARRYSDVDSISSYPYGNNFTDIGRIEFTDYIRIITKDGQDIYMNNSNIHMFEKISESSKKIKNLTIKAI